MLMVRTLAKHALGVPLTIKRSAFWQTLWPERGRRCRTRAFHLPPTVTRMPLGNCSPFALSKSGSWESATPIAYGTMPYFI
jgi:hypothetical protein